MTTALSAVLLKQVFIKNTTQILCGTLHIIGNFKEKKVEV